MNTLKPCSLDVVHAERKVFSVVAHEIRAPLNVINLSAAELARTACGDRTLTRIATQLQAAVVRACRLADDLLGDARIGTGGLSIKPATQRCADVLADVGELEIIARAHSVRLDVRAAPHDLLVRCDRARIAQVLSNLVSNAIKFAPPESAVSVRVAETEGWVRFAVEDRGPGVAPEAIPYVFERFWQARTSSCAGVGLGLFIARAIVEAHGGVIWLESHYGFGSTFYFTLRRPTVDLL